MVVMMLFGADAKVMGPFVIRSRLRNLGWLATFVMGATVFAMFATL